MRILLAGASGLVGGEVMERALGSGRITALVSLARRVGTKRHAKLTEWLGSEGDVLNGLRPERVDAVICCLGTTMRNVGGDKAKFIQVDKDLVLGLARWAKEQGARTFVVVSAIGADARSRVFYNRVKGEMEHELKSLGFPELHVFHPSILVGPRKETRLGERIGIAVMSAVAPLLPDHYKPMPYDVLAKAMLNCIGMPGGTHTYREILAFAGA